MGVISAGCWCLLLVGVVRQWLLVVAVSDGHRWSSLVVDVSDGCILWMLLFAADGGRWWWVLVLFFSSGPLWWNLVVLAAGCGCQGWSLVLMVAVSG